MGFRFRERIKQLAARPAGSVLPLAAREESEVESKAELNRAAGHAVSPMLRAAIIAGVEAAESDLE